MNAKVGFDIESVSVQIKFKAKKYKNTDLADHSQDSPRIPKAYVSFRSLPSLLSPTTRTLKTTKSNPR